MNCCVYLRNSAAWPRFWLVQNNKQDNTWSRPCGKGSTRHLLTRLLHAQRPGFLPGTEHCAPDFPRQLNRLAFLQPLKEERCFWRGRRAEFIVGHLHQKLIMAQRQGALPLFCIAAHQFSMSNLNKSIVRDQALINPCRLPVPFFCKIQLP